MLSSTPGVSAMLNVKMRRCPNVPCLVVTVRALSSSGRVVGTMPAAACSGVGAGGLAEAPIRRASRAACGAKRVFLTCRTSSVRRSRPTRWCAAAVALHHPGSPAWPWKSNTSWELSKTRHGSRVDVVVRPTL